MVEIELKNMKVINEKINSIMLNEDDQRIIINNIHNHIVGKTPHKSGSLRRSLRFIVKGGEWELWGYTYFHYLNKGTRSHWIFPIYAKALSWIDEETHERRFSKGHQVSGINAFHIIDEDELMKMLKEGVLRHVSKLANK